jgi:hypothetical protein
MSPPRVMPIAGCGKEKTVVWLGEGRGWAELPVRVGDGLGARVKEETRDENGWEHTCG